MTLLQHSERLAESLLYSSYNLQPPTTYNYKQPPPQSYPTQSMVPETASSKLESQQDTELNLDRD